MKKELFLFSILIFFIANVSAIEQGVQINPPRQTSFSTVNNVFIINGTADGIILNWLNITNFPSGCGPGEYVIAVGSTLTCSGAFNITYQNFAYNQTQASIANNIYWNKTGNDIYPSDLSFMTGLGTQNASSRFDINITGIGIGAIQVYNRTPSNSYFYINDTNGFVGIGRNNPTYTLDIATTAPSMRIGRTGTFSGIAPYMVFQGSNENNITMGYRDGTGNFVIGRGTDITNNEMMVINRVTGNVSIGNTAGTSLLHVGNGTDNPIYAGTATIIEQEGVTAFAVRNSLQNTEANIWVGGSGTVQFGSGSQSNVSITSSDRNRILIRDNGLVGINATTPQYMLQIQDDDNALNVSGQLYANITSIGIGTSKPATTLDIVANPSGLVNGYGIVRIAKNTTNSGDGKSDVVNGTYLQIGGLEFNVNNANPTYHLIGFGYSQLGNPSPSYIGYLETANSGQTQGSLIFGTRNSTATGNAALERMRIDHRGFVGINTTTPNYLLEINGLSNGLNVSNNLFANATGVGIGTSTPGGTAGSLNLFGVTPQLVLNSSSADSGWITFYNSTSGRKGYIQYVVAGGQDRMIYDAGGSSGFTFQNGALNETGEIYSNTRIWAGGGTSTAAINIATNNSNGQIVTPQIIAQINGTNNVGAGIGVSINMDGTNRRAVLFINNNSVVNGGRWGLGMGYSSGELPFVINMGGVDAMMIEQSSHLLGINTTNPDYMLQIQSANRGLNVSSNLYANATGVGIGTSNPTQAFNVIGNGNVTGIMYVGNLTTQDLVFAGLGLNYRFVEETNALNLRNSSNAVIMNLTQTGAIFNEVSVPTISVLPTCNSATRGKMYMVLGGIGVADTAWICSKSALDIYTWSPII